MRPPFFAGLRGINFMSPEKFQIALPPILYGLIFVATMLAIRKKRKVVKAAVFLGLAMPMLGWIVLKWAGAAHFHTANVGRHGADIIRILAGDRCELLQSPLYVPSQDRYLPQWWAFAGDVFGPSLSAATSTSASGFMRIFPYLKYRRRIAEAEIFVDGKKVDVRLANGWRYSSKDSRRIVEAIASAESGRIVFGTGGDSGEAVLNSADICRMKKMRDLMQKSSDTPRLAAFLPKRGD